MKIHPRLAIILPCITFVYSASETVFALDPVELRYAMFQDGYSEGATVTGTFTGSDLDGNGLLIHFPVPSGGPGIPIEHMELTSFSMHFSGNSMSPAFDLGLGDLYGFVYQLGTAGIGDDPAYDPTLDENLTEGIGAIGAVRFYTSGLGPNGFIGGYVGGQITNPSSLEENALDSSQQLVRVTLVPEPGTGVVVLVVALLAAARHRRF